MRKLISWLMGFSLGTALGAALTLFFAPMSGSELKESLKNHYRDALDAGHEGGELKRAQLEEELRQMRQARGLTPKTK